MISRQFCSVCKQWLDMEVVQTADGEDDGVVWFRCPQCQGFLPKLSSAVPGIAATDRSAQGDGVGDGDPGRAGAGGVEDDGEIDDVALDDVALDDVAIAAAAGAGDVIDDDVIDDQSGADDGDESDDGDDGDDDGDDDHDSPSPAGARSAEPIHEYAAMLAAVDPGAAIPYRPWETYEVGQCILHLAWNDCGVVVAKEDLPGGRRVVKCWFQGAGVVRLIENAPR